MNSLTKILIHNTQPSTLLMGAGSVVAGLAASCTRGGFSVFPAVLTMCFTLFLQISANLRYGYSDLAYMMGENFNMASDGINKSDTISPGAHMRMLKIMSNAFLILAITIGMPLLEFIGWQGLGYAAVLLLASYVMYSGPKPLIRTTWGLLMTFFVFGPLCVSGTAFIQNPFTTVTSSIVICSIIGGLLAVNAHIAMGYTRYREDLMNNKSTITVTLGRKATRTIYLADSLTVGAAIIIGPYLMHFSIPILGAPVAICYLVSATAIFFRMRSRPSHNSRRIRIVTAMQYFLTTLLMLIIVIICTDGNLNIVHFSV